MDLPADEISLQYSHRTALTAARTEDGKIRETLNGCRTKTFYHTQVTNAEFLMLRGNNQTVRELHDARVYHHSIYAGFEATHIHFEGVSV